ncbi:Ca2+-binding EF-hand superfamily protein [Rhodopseudomonas julia]|uniref:Ca2+-binding EF-hand superfamily protein n=1 Tax=Rhodopseudomonas julia TaxID=200617 RepID=A0ABU0C7W3_9BRAD|nr:EF-hand domain-containing protein [Rhodopseudomonas julia]MDQ0326554.1 Ca2+-binding EF-hand superfamily protein [Rhodopseudomonas julia]
MGQGMGQGMAARVDAMDTNGDGVISLGEATAWHQSVFDTMDSNGDGQLTKDEYMSVRFAFGPGGGQGPRAAQMTQRKEARFTQADTNKDGRLSQDEFMASGKSRFAAADYNKDGRVTPAEFAASRNF